MLPQRSVESLASCEVLVENIGATASTTRHRSTRVIDRFGSDHLMVEVDYPHADSTWPDVHRLLHERLRRLPGDNINEPTHRNVEELFR